MVGTFDVFRIVPEGVRWIGSAESLEEAKALIKAKLAEQPGDFLIVSLVTGWKMEIKAPGTAA
jgi:hypothetical protein